MHEDSFFFYTFFSAAGARPNISGLTETVDLTQTFM